MRTDKNRIKDEIDEMSLEEAREAISSSKYGAVGSSNFETAMLYLNFKESAIRDGHDKINLSLTRIILIITTGSFLLAAVLAIFNII